MINANDFSGVSDSDILEAAIAAAIAADGNVVIPPRKQSSEPERNWWLIDRAILLPENITVIIRNCKIKMSDISRDNIFRSANCGIGIEDIKTFKNIHIKGDGYAVLEGADHPRATGDSSKTLENPCPKNLDELVKYGSWIPEERREIGKIDFWDIHNHTYGTDSSNPDESQTGDWRNIGVLFACVENFSVENIHLTSTHCWALSFENCSHGKISKIDFDMDMSKVIDGMRHNMENQDGIDIRNGCHDIIISDISGGTGDDLVALTAIAKSEAEFRPSGSLYSTHVMHNDWTKRDPSIHDIIIRDVHGLSAGGICYVVRLLSCETEIYNVVVDNVIDAATDKCHGDGVVLIGEFDCGYGKILKNGIHDISISNIICNSNGGVLVEGYLTDSVISNVISRRPGAEALRVAREDGLNNVLTYNICNTSK